MLIQRKIMDKFYTFKIKLNTILILANLKVI